MLQKKSEGDSSPNHPETAVLSIARSIWRFTQSRAKKLRRRIEGKILQARWALSFDRDADSAAPSQGPVIDALAVKVINLDHRTDRLAAFSREMESLGIERWHRIPAVDGKKKYVNLDAVFAASIACTESHIYALISTDWSSVAAAFICEDDLEFLASRTELESVVSEFLNNPRLSVLCLSGRARGASLAISRGLRIATGIVGRGCYLVKPEAAKPLITAFQAGIPALVLGRREGKGDQMWGRLQRRGYFFAMPRTQIAHQSAGYSDIEGTVLGPR